MVVFRQKYHVKSTRLKNWDYSNPGYYFVTLCTKDQICYFGRITKLKPNSLGSVIGQFKSVCTKKIRQIGNDEFAWQSRFFDHIIRNGQSLNNIRQYIQYNPTRWEIDRNHPDGIYR